MIARKIAYCLTVPVLLSAADIYAQTREFTADAPEGQVARGDTVAQRQRPDYDAIGVRLGGFMLLPTLSLQESYNSNIFASEDDEESDFITSIEPALNLRSNWNNHALNLHADSKVSRYADNSSEDFEDYTLSADGRLDVLRDLRLFGGAGYRVRHIARYDPDSPTNTAEPAEYEVYGANAGIEKVFNRLSLRFDAARDQYRYDNIRLNDGTTRDEGDRDRDQTTLSLRTGYEIGPLRQVYLLGSYNWRDYERRVDDAGFERNSDGYLLAVGTEYDLTGITFLDGYIGYRVQEYDDPRLKEMSGWAAGLKLTWNVTQLTTLTGSLNRSVEETTQNGASGYFATRASIRADHELLRNLILNASVGFENDEFEGINRDDDYFLAGLGARYLMNRFLSVSGGYGYRTRDSNLPNADFDENVVFIRLTGQL